MAPPPPIDYGVYLVTDSTPAILGDRDLVDVVRAAVRGGVTCVQYRDKTCGHAQAVDVARRLHAVTSEAGVPLLINDRVDVAVDVGCEGVHIGQEDMAFQEARRLLGPDKIIGVTASSVDEALRASEAGATYLGIGTVYATQTKKDTKSIIGTSGLRDILAALAAAGHAALPTVCIGGITTANAALVLAQSAAPRKSLSGLAVVSALVAAPDPAAAARALLARVLAARVPRLVRRVADANPLSHNMTNLVVQNFAANVALAVGASPIMANYAEEAADLARLGGALVVNMGTVTPDGLAGYEKALRAYNEAGRPVVLDPVGAGATSVRRNAVKSLLAAGHFAIIKGNAAELQTVYAACAPDPASSVPQQQQPEQPQQRGVDDAHSTLSIPQKAALVRSLARRRRCVALLTGATDLLSDGRRTVRVDNGHEILGRITGTGCTLGTTVSAMAAAAVVPTTDGNAPAEAEDVLTAAVAGTVLFGVAAEFAAQRPEVRGPGTFVPAFLDELHLLRKATAEGDLRWLTMAKVEVVDVDADVDGGGS